MSQQAPPPPPPQQQRSYKIIDSHLHVWGNEKDVIVYPYQQVPPDDLKNSASTEQLLQQMNDWHIDGALIVQPINYKNDHSFVIQAMKQYPTKFKGMMLYDPLLHYDNIDDAMHRFQDLILCGFVGVRFNPYLWPKMGEQQWEDMSKLNSVGLKIYQACGDFNIPVGIMCFQGLQYHYNDIIKLLETSPKTIMILDHFAFTSLDNDKPFEQLLSLAKYSNVIIKISALFRLNDTDTSSYSNVYRKRFLPLLQAYGSHRLMYGSDYPFVLQQTTQQYSIYQLIESWTPNDIDKHNIMGGTAERIFGSWGSSISPSS